MARRYETDDEAFERWRDEYPDEWDEILGGTQTTPETRQKQPDKVTA